jgi:hypothetical protein
MKFIIPENNAVNVGIAGIAGNEQSPITNHLSPLTREKSEFDLTDPCLTLGPVRGLVSAL